jgi:trimethylamine---corrinoid protein Co-methyltransferase
LTEQPSPARREGRRRRGGGVESIPQPAPGQARLPFPPMRIISDDEVEAIHRASLDLLEEIGMDVLNPEARDLYAAAGARVEGERVRIGREIIEEALKTAPAEFTMYCRNPERNLRMGGNWIAFWPVGGPPNCSDIDRGRRPGTLEDNHNFIRLAQFFNCVSGAGGGSVDALDYHARIRHLHIYRGIARLPRPHPPFAHLPRHAAVVGQISLRHLDRPPAPVRRHGDDAHREGSDA